MDTITNKLDDLANNLELSGELKLAHDIDIISNTIEEIKESSGIITKQIRLEGLIPAVKDPISGDIVLGRPGETHKEILNKVNNPESRTILEKEYLKDLIGKYSEFIGFKDMLGNYGTINKFVPRLDVEDKIKETQKQRAERPLLQFLQ